LAKKITKKKPSQKKTIPKTSKTAKKKPTKMQSSKKDNADDTSELNSRLEKLEKQIDALSSKV